MSTISSDMIISNEQVNFCLRNYFNTYDIISQELCQAELDIVTLK